MNANLDAPKRKMRFTIPKMWNVGIGVSIRKAIASADSKGGIDKNRPFSLVVLMDDAKNSGYAVVVHPKGKREAWFSESRFTGKSGVERYSPRQAFTLDGAFIVKEENLHNKQTLKRFNK